MGGNVSAEGEAGNWKLPVDFRDGRRSNEWVTVYAASEAATGAKTTTQEGKKLARENLQLMLFLNLLKIAEMFPRQPEKLALYMQQSLLMDHPQQPEEPTPPTP
jgi:hypothetical protein